MYILVCNLHFVYILFMCINLSFSTLLSKTHPARVSTILRVRLVLTFFVKLPIAFCLFCVIPYIKPKLVNQISHSKRNQEILAWPNDLSLQDLPMGTGGSHSAQVSTTIKFYKIAIAVSSNLVDIISSLFVYFSIDVSQRTNSN